MSLATARSALVFLLVLTAACKGNLVPQTNDGGAVEPAAGVSPPTPEPAPLPPGPTATATSTGTAPATAVTPPIPTDLAYGAATFSVGIGSLLDTGAATVKCDAPVTYSVEPPLPAGLAFTAADGRIRGRPTALQAETSYTVTAATAAGDSATVQIKLAVVDPIAGRAGLRAWYRADQSVYKDAGATQPAGDDEAVAVWKDLAPGARDLKQTFRNPPKVAATAINGKPGLKFVSDGGAAQTLATDAAFGNAKFTAFTVGMVPAPTIYWGLAWSIADAYNWGSGAAHLAHHHEGNGEPAGLYKASGELGAAPVGLGAPAGDMSYEHGKPFVAWHETADRFPDRRLVVGGDIQGWIPWQGYIAEHVFVDGALPVADQAAIVNALMLRWGMTPNVVAEEPGELPVSRVTALDWTPKFSAAPASVRVSPPLPAGLTADATTGKVTGKATGAFTPQAHSFTALDADGKPTEMRLIRLVPAPVQLAFKSAWSGDTMCYPRNVVLDGTKLYLVARTKATDCANDAIMHLRSIDVANPAAPALLSRLNHDYNAWIGPLEKSGTQLFHTGWCCYVNVADASNPASLSHVYEEYMAGTYPTSLRVTGGYAYTGSDNGIIQLVSLAALPADLSVTGSVAPVAGATKVHVDVEGTRLFSRSGEASTIRTYDASTPATPTLSGPVTATADLTGNGFDTRDFLVDSKRVFVLSTNGKKLQVFDWRDPAAPFLAASFTFTFKPVSLALDGGYLAVAGSDGTTGVLEILDVTDLSVIRSAAKADWDGTPAGIAAQSGTIAVTDEVKDTVRLYRLD